MATFADLTKNIESPRQPAQPSVPSNFVFATPSGTNRLKTKFVTGGNVKAKKKVPRNPTPIFGTGMASFDNRNSSGTSRPVYHTAPITAAEGVVNIASAPKIYNWDTMPERAETTVVYGMQRMGGAGVRFAEDMVEKREELKLLKGFITEGTGKQIRGLSTKGTPVHESNTWENISKHLSVKSRRLGHRVKAGL